MFKDKKIRLFFFYVGYSLLIVGALSYILRWPDYLFYERLVGLYIVVVGAVLCSVFRLLLLPQSSDRRIRRLNNQQFLCIVFQLGAVYCMWIYNPAWVALLLLCAITDIWLSFRYSKKA